MPNYWLVKTEPEAYSFSDLQRDGHTNWDGVRNYQARNNLRLMQPGDLVAVYHSVSEKAVAGLARVTRGSAQDTTTTDANWVAVELVPEQKFSKPVSLAAIKQTPELENIGLLKQSRLSVMPLTPVEFEKLVELGK